MIIAHRNSCQSTSCAQHCFRSHCL